MNKKHSNIAVALLFFIVGIGTGIVIGGIMGYSTGYKNAYIYNSHPDTIKIYKFIKYPEELKLKEL